MATHGIHGAVDCFTELPDAITLDMNITFLVREDEDAPNGAGMYWVQKSSTGKHWVFLEGISRFQKDVTLNPDGSSLEEPRVLGVTHFDSGEAARLELGDAWNAVQSAFGNNLSLNCYHSLHLIGRRFDGTTLGAPLPYGWPNETPGSINDAGTMVINTQPGIVALVVDGSPDGQTADLQQWRDNTLAKAILARITAAGDFQATGGIEAKGKIKLENLPSSDPAEAGVLWNDSGTLKVSAG